MDRNNPSDDDVVRLAREAVRIEVEKKRAMKLPVIVYDHADQKIYEVYADGTRKAVGSRLTRGHYSERTR